MFTPVGNLLSSFSKRSRVSTAVSALVVMQVFREVLAEVCSDLPKAKISEIKAKSFKEGQLEVLCTGLMTSELSMRSGELIRALNDKVGRRVVTRIKFVH